MFLDKNFFNTSITYFFLTFPIILFAGNAIGNLFFLTLTIFLIINFFLFKPSIKLNFHENTFILARYNIILFLLKGFFSLNYES